MINNRAIVHKISRKPLIRPNGRAPMRENQKCLFVVNAILTSFNPKFFHKEFSFSIFSSIVLYFMQLFPGNFPVVPRDFCPIWAHEPGLGAFAWDDDCVARLCGFYCLANGFSSI